LPNPKSQDERCESVVFTWETCQIQISAVATKYGDGEGSIFIQVTPTTVRVRVRWSCKFVGAFCCGSGRIAKISCCRLSESMGTTLLQTRPVMETKCARGCDARGVRRSHEVAGNGSRMAGGWLQMTPVAIGCSQCSDSLLITRSRRLPGLSPRQTSGELATRYLCDAKSCLDLDAYYTLSSIVDNKCEDFKAVYLTLWSLPQIL
jgi:hypothetical protein